MTKFNTFTVNEPLAKSFKSVFDNREIIPAVNISKGIQSSVYPKETLPFAEWKQYIHNELKKDLKS